jgi:hypothetical protein
MTQTKGFFRKTVEVLVRARRAQAEQRVDAFLKTHTPSELSKRH